MLEGFKEVTDYLANKRLSVNVNNPKANTGAVVLREEYEEHELRDLVGEAIHTIQENFTKTNTEVAAGEAKLTNVSMHIGRYVCKRPPEYDNTGLYNEWVKDIRVGDLFVEAFFKTGFIDLYYPERRDSFHIITPTNKWTDLKPLPLDTITRVTRNTVEVKPPLISGPTQIHKDGDTDYPIIKKKPTAYINLDAPWVKSINKLQRTGWKVNSRVLETLLDNSDKFTSSIEIKDKERRDEELKRRSKIIEWAFITKKAKYLDGRTFYQMVDADYRGRVYYCEPFFSFQGSDVARGMMLFDREKPMDSHGLYWLAVHTACSYNKSYNIDEIPDWCEEDYVSYLQDEGLDSISLDKMSLNDRVNWVNNNMDMLRDSGETCELHMDAEKPVSFLACCIEWHDYHVARDAGLTHRTSLPIPIDGSNNGWQHLGAISKDVQTGELVGLTSVNIQKDFYVQTAKELYRLTEDGELKDLLDRMPMKHIRKGISKRGSMTRAYSAGAAKIGENMWFDCKTEDYHKKYGITEDNCMALAKLLIKAINNVCPGPLKTMGYLQGLASVIIADEDASHKLEWNTPSGFEVEYECYYSKRCVTKGTISGYTKYNERGVVNHKARVYSDFPDMRGFMCGISPNYIHSMDAAHMALVINDWTGDFGAVHDGFSTHACDVETLLATTKRKFIEIYNEDNYYNIIKQQIVGDREVLLDQPDLGNLNIEEIEDSDYFFA